VPDHSVGIGEVIRKGSCLCGHVTFELHGEPQWVAHCHCDMCRRATGAVVATYAGYEYSAAVFNGNTLKSYESSPGVFRKFCSNCGSSVSFEGDKWPNEIHILISLLDNPDTLTPQVHVFTCDRVKWLQMDDELPKFDKLPPAD
jgi:hypothetical protein